MLLNHARATRTSAMNLCDVNRTHTKLPRGRGVYIRLCRCFPRRKFCPWIETVSGLWNLIICSPIDGSSAPHHSRGFVEHLPGHVSRISLDLRASTTPLLQFSTVYGLCISTRSPSCYSPVVEPYESSIENQRVSIHIRNDSSLSITLSGEWESRCSS